MNKTSRFPLVLLLVIFAAVALRASAMVFTEDTYIGPADTSYDGQDIVVLDCALTVDGPHTFSSLVLAANAILTHSASTNGELPVVLSVTNAPYVLPGPATAVELANSNIFTPLLVTDTNGNAYTGGVDYREFTYSNSIWIEQTTNSSIPDDGTVLVSYSYDGSVAAGLDLTVTGVVWVSAGCEIDADRIGYGPGFGPGAGSTSANEFSFGPGGGGDFRHLWSVPHGALLRNIYGFVTDDFRRGHRYKRRGCARGSDGGERRTCRRDNGYQWELFAGRAFGLDRDCDAIARFQCISTGFDELYKRVQPVDRSELFDGPDDLAGSDAEPERGKLCIELERHIGRDLPGVLVHQSPDVATPRQPYRRNQRSDGILHAGRLEPPGILPITGDTLRTGWVDWRIRAPMRGDALWIAKFPECTDKRLLVPLHLWFLLSAPNFFA
ncbi:MAG: hypothetical protein ACREFR_17660 [Limisphaerales bacterium]